MLAGSAVIESYLRNGQPVMEPVIEWESNGRRVENVKNNQGNHVGFRAAAPAFGPKMTCRHWKPAQSTMQPEGSLLNLVPSCPVIPFTKGH